MFTAAVSHADTVAGFKGQLKVKKMLSGKYTSADEIALYDEIIAIYGLFETNSQTSADAQVKEHFKKGKDIWQRLKKFNPTYSADRYLFKDLCNAVTNYYMATNRLYETIPYYKMLAEDAYDINLLDQHLLSLMNTAETYLNLGQTESAKELIKKIKSIVDDYFELDIDDIKANRPHFVVVNTAYRTLAVKASMMDGYSDANIKDEQRFFDFLLKYYDYKYMTPYIKVAGGITTENYFEINVSKDTIKDKMYRVNDGEMFTFAKLFALNGDFERAGQALKEAVKSVSESRGTPINDLSETYPDALITKEAMSMTSLSGYWDKFGMLKAKYRLVYLEHLYKAVINMMTGRLNESSFELLDAQTALKKLNHAYSYLPPEFYYIDNMQSSYSDLLGTEALLYEKRKEYEFAAANYKNLINVYEKYRESLPVEYRRGFFRGYSKDAYLGMIRAKAGEYSQKKTEGSFNAFLTAVDMLNARQFKDIKPEFSSADPSLSAVRSGLKNDEMIYLIIDSGTENITAGISKTAYSLDISPKAKGQDRLTKRSKDDLAKNHVYDKKMLADLTHSLVAPLDRFKGVRKIHLLSDGAVSALPFDILPYKNSMIFDSFTVDHIITLNGLKNNVFKPAYFLGIADPEYEKKHLAMLRKKEVSRARSVDISGYFQALPETRDEVTSIAGMLGKSSLLLGADAVESRIKSMPLDAYTILHFATHGILGGEIPGMDEPALVMSEETGQDSLLTASEIAKLKISADMVVLSACNTGSGQYFRGEGVTGIARAFELAGASNVIASLWPVDSFATKTLMEYFYGFMKQGLKPSEALHMAKQKLRMTGEGTAGNDRSLKKSGGANTKFTGYQNPYFWSGFILIAS